jgi:adenosylhomocysteine nucleosidase
MPFRYLFQSWLRQTAAQKVRETVVEAARQQLEATASGPPAGDPPTQCDFGVVFALGIEAGSFEDMLGDVQVLRGQNIVVRAGELRGRSVVVVQSGAGCAQAAKATHALVDAHHPRWVISAGFAGALDPALQRGVILVADSLVHTDGRQWTADAATWPAWLGEVRGVRLGRLLTADRVARLPDEKRSLGSRHAALAVDMESLAVAEVCVERGVRFLAVRVVNDVVDEELPPDVERLLAQPSNAARLGAAVGSIWRRPGSVKDLWKLRENAMAASDRLANYLAAIMKHL